MTINIEDWELEFDKQFTYEYGNECEVMWKWTGKSEARPPEIKDFVKSLLATQKKKFLELLEDNRKETMWANKDDQEVSDKGVDDFIKAIKIKLNK